MIKNNTKLSDKENVKYQKEYRNQRKSKGWKYFSIMVPEKCHDALKRFYLKWKSDNLKYWD